MMIFASSISILQIKAGSSSMRVIGRAYFQSPFYRDCCHEELKILLSRKVKSRHSVLFVGMVVGLVVDEFLAVF